jgi:hypothetical protein
MMAMPMTATHTWLRFQAFDLQLPERLHTWSEMETVGGWTVRTGGRPYFFVKPGRTTIPGESKLGVDYFDPKADVEAFACQHYGWRGNDDDNNNLDHGTEGIVLTGA